jgi:G3E family GTPase
LVLFFRKKWSFMTKITIFSGFLGAGKTTLIKKLIKEGYNGEKLVLIENEFGQIGIDGGFLKDAGIEITEMNSGCICCSLVGDFGKALVQVLEEYKPDRIIIEPSGVGKLSDVIKAVQAIGSDDAILNSYTTVVDAAKCKMYMKNFGEFFNDQVENAATIILSHTSSAGDAKCQKCIELIREHNADAVIVATSWDKIDGKDILAAMERENTLEAQMQKLKDEEACPVCGHHHHDEHHHEHSHGQCHAHHHDHDEHCHCGGHRAAVQYAASRGTEPPCLGKSGGTVQRCPDPKTGYRRMSLSKRHFPGSTPAIAGTFPKSGDSR